jgi:hypothetical protein
MMNSLKTTVTSEKWHSLNSKVATVTILISTIDERIDNVPAVLLTPMEGIRYIVSYQYRSEKEKRVPMALIRDNVLVSQIPGSGVTPGPV